MSGESTPILSNSIPAFKLFLSSWENLATKHPKLKPWIEIGPDHAINYYQCMDRTSSYVIAMGKALKLLFVTTVSIFNSPVLNPTICMSWICKLWDQQYINDAECK